jgi:hypothetical protein
MLYELIGIVSEPPPFAPKRVLSRNLMKGSGIVQLTRNCRSAPTIFPRCESTYRFSLLCVMAMRYPMQLTFRPPVVLVPFVTWETDPSILLDVLPTNIRSHSIDISIHWVYWPSILRHPLLHVYASISPRQRRKQVTNHSRAPQNRPRRRPAHPPAEGRDTRHLQLG